MGDKESTTRSITGVDETPASELLNDLGNEGEGNVKSHGCALHLNRMLGGGRCDVEDGSNGVFGGFGEDHLGILE